MSKQQDKIQQMINFIENEAREKANEIAVQADEQFAIEKQNLVDQAKRKIKETYDQKEKQVEIDKQIAISNEIKEQRLNVLKKRDQVLKDMLEEAKKDLLEVTKDANKYKIVLRDLLLQALCTLREKTVTVSCREADKSLLQSIISEAESTFSSKTGINTKVTIATQFLNPKSCGGIIVYALGDRIKVDNTLEERLNLCSQAIVPDIRNIIFPKKQH